MKRNAVGWFEIPVGNMKRAIGFYEAVFGVKLEHNILGTLEMAWFPEVENGPGSSGSLVYHSEFYKPSSDGILIYFTSPTGDLTQEEKKIAEAGGKILINRRLISEEIGYMTVFLDSEGNRIALHSIT